MGNSLSRNTKSLRLKAFNEERWYTISIPDKSCECSAFEASGQCEHLEALGLFRSKPFTPRARPTFSQALSGLIKSIRIRRVEDAAYWLVYLDTFTEPNQRLRTVRRMLIDSAEDGHSVAVMESVREELGTMTKPRAELPNLVTAAARICRLPNWWHPGSGGRDYIYSSLVGERRWRYTVWDHSAATLLRAIEKGVGDKDAAMAIGAVTAFCEVNERFGSTKQAEFLLGLAERVGHTLAARLCRIHLSAKSALSGDNNFLCQAAWMLAGGVSPVAECSVSVTTGECEQLLDQARERWKDPQPIPRWCLDGVHSAGDDFRFMGMLPAMFSVCEAYRHYGRVDPNDEWLSEFRCFDGLVIEPHPDAADSHASAERNKLPILLHSPGSDASTHESLQTLKGSLT